MKDKEALKTFGRVFTQKYQKFYRHALGVSKWDTFNSHDILQDASESMLLYILRGAEFENEDHLINTFHLKIQRRGKVSNMRGNWANRYEDVMYVDEYPYDPTLPPPQEQIKLSDVISCINVKKSSHKGAGIDIKKSIELRRIINLEVMGFTRQEIADKTGLSVGQVTEKINRYRRKIRA